MDEFGLQFLVLNVLLLFVTNWLYSVWFVIWKLFGDDCATELINIF